MENKTKKNRSVVVKKKPLVLDDEIKTWIKQSNTITNMIADYNLIQVRALVILVEAMQQAINGAIDQRPNEQLSLFQNEIDKYGKLNIIIPMKNFGVPPYRYTALKAALKEFSNIPVEFKVDSVYAGKNATKYTHLLDVTIPEKYQKSVEFSIDKEVAEKFLNMQGGFTKFLKEVVMALDSPYNIKFYYMCCSWLAKGGWTMKYEDLRTWLCLGDKYQEFKDLNKRVLKPTQENLEKHSNCWFEYNPVFVGDEKVPRRINFKIFRSSYTVEEEQRLETQTNYLRDLLFKHYQIQDRDFSQQIKPLLTLYNVERAITKFMEISMYIQEHTKDIHDKKKYVLACLVDDLTPTL